MPISGVNNLHYSDYNFQDHIWSQPATKRDDLLELANRCVQINGIYWMKIPNSPRWEPFKTMPDAIRQAQSTWLHARLKCGSQITAEMIQTFFTGIEVSSVQIGTKIINSKTPVGACPQIAGRMVIPYGAQFIEFQGQKYLNTSDTSLVQGDVAHVHKGRLILEMIYRSLCDGKELHPDHDSEADMLLEQVLTDKYTQLEFRFVMNWLAAIYQMPGINLQTNLWLCGQQEGIGKGTLLEVMRAVMGHSMVGFLNQTEIEAGYSDCLFGKALIEVNEFDSSGRWSGKAWNKWIKAHTCETMLPIRARYLGSWTTLNIGNYIFTTNDENPVHMDMTDRRNMMVQTTNDPFWKDYSSVIKSTMIANRLPELAAGFAWILKNVKVDMSLIMTAPLTQLKADNQESSKSEIEQWLDADLALRGTTKPARTLHEFYKNWHREAMPGRTPMSETMWGLRMGGLVKLGRITKKKTTIIEYTIPLDLTQKRGESQRALSAKIIAKILSEEVVVVDHDAEVAPPPPPAPMTPIERIRDALRRERGNVVDFPA